MGTNRKLFFTLRLLSLWLLLFTHCFALVIACNTNEKSKASAAAEAKKNAAELQQSAGTARQALQKLEAPLADLNGKYDTLHKEYSALPADLPGFAEPRAQFFTAYVTLGQLSTKRIVLLSRIDEAVKSGDRAELEAINRDIATIPAEIGIMDKLALESLHKVLPLKKAAENYVPEAFGQTACENPNPAPAKEAVNKKARASPVIGGLRPPPRPAKPDRGPTSDFAAPKGGDSSEVLVR
jgi:hypothetical protein